MTHQEWYWAPLIVKAHDQSLYDRTGAALWLPSRKIIGIQKVKAFTLKPKKKKIYIYSSFVLHMTQQWAGTPEALLLTSTTKRGDKGLQFRCWYTAFYVLLSAALQKITAVDAGRKAGARKTCHTKGIYSVTLLLPLITQHYCPYSVRPQCEALFKLRQQTKGSVGTKGKATCGMTPAAAARQIIKLSRLM